MVNTFSDGYEFALKEINTPMLMITENWCPSVCPKCKAIYEEDCNDGYYDRHTNLERCPECGQKIEWS